MDTRTEDLALLKQVREKTKKLAELRSSIHEKKSELERLQNESVKPENYHILPTNNLTTLTKKIEGQRSKIADRTSWISYAITLALNVCLFVFTIIWLANCPEDAYICQINEGAAILFWIAHIIYGLLVAALPTIGGYIAVFAGEGASK